MPDPPPAAVPQSRIRAPDIAPLLEANNVQPRLPPPGESTKSLLRNRRRPRNARPVDLPCAADPPRAVAPGLALTGRAGGPAGPRGYDGKGHRGIMRGRTDIQATRLHPETGPDLPASGSYGAEPGLRSAIRYRLCPGPTLRR